MNLFKFYFIISALFFYSIDIYSFEDRKVFEIFRHLRIVENFDDYKDPEKSKRNIKKFWKKTLINVLNNKLFLNQNPLLKKDFSKKIKNAALEKLFQKILVNNKIETIKLSKNDLYENFIKVLYKKLENKEYQNKLESFLIKKRK